MLKTFAALALGIILTVSPSFTFEPGYFRIKVQVPQAKENRLLTIIIDGDNFYRQSDVQLNGENAPKTSWMELPRVPAGDYVIVAALITTSGVKETVRQEVHVLGRQ